MAAEFIRKEGENFYPSNIDSELIEVDGEQAIEAVYSQIKNKLDL